MKDPEVEIRRYVSAPFGDIPLLISVSPEFMMPSSN